MGNLILFVQGRWMNWANCDNGTEKHDFLSIWFGSCLNMHVLKSPWMWRLQNPSVGQRFIVSRSLFCDGLHWVVRKWRFKTEDANIFWWDSTIIGLEFRRWHVDVSACSARFKNCFGLFGGWLANVGLALNIERKSWFKQRNSAAASPFSSWNVRARGCCQREKVKRALDSKQIYVGRCWWRTSFSARDCY